MVQHVVSVAVSSVWERVSSSAVSSLGYWIYVSSGPVQVLLFPELRGGLAVWLLLWVHKAGRKVTGVEGLP